MLFLQLAQEWSRTQFPLDRDINKNTAFLSHQRTWAPTRIWFSAPRWRHGAKSTFISALSVKASHFCSATAKWSRSGWFRSVPTLRKQLQKDESQAGFSTFSSLNISLTRKGWKTSKQTIWSHKQSSTTGTLLAAGKSGMEHKVQHMCVASELHLGRFGVKFCFQFSPTCQQLTADGFVEKDRVRVLRRFRPFSLPLSGLTRNNCPTTRAPGPPPGSRSVGERTAVTTFISSSERWRFAGVSRCVSVEADDLARLMGRREASLCRCVLSSVSKAKHCSF